MKTYIYKTGST